MSARVLPRNIPFHIKRKLLSVGAQIKNRGYGFVTFAEESALAEGISQFDGKELQGKPLSVKIAMDRKPEENQPVDSAAAPSTSAAEIATTSDE